MHCKDCSRFNEDSRKCRDEKLNPQTWDEAVNVANCFGVRSVCVFNDFRERLVVARTAPDRYPRR